MDANVGKNKLGPCGFEVVVDVVLWFRAKSKIVARACTGAVVVVGASAISSILGPAVGWRKSNIAMGRGASELATGFSQSAV